MHAFVPWLGTAIIAHSIALCCRICPAPIAIVLRPCRGEVVVVVVAGNVLGRLGSLPLPSATAPRTTSYCTDGYAKALLLGRLQQGGIRRPSQSAGSLYSIKTYGKTLILNTVGLLVLTLCIVPQDSLPIHNQPVDTTATWYQYHTATPSNTATLTQSNTWYPRPSVHLLAAPAWPFQIQHPTRLVPRSHHSGAPHTKPLQLHKLLNSVPSSPYSAALPAAARPRSASIRA